MDVLIVQIEDDITALEIGSETQDDVAKFIERVADHSRQPVKYATVDVTGLSEWGPGDVADNLADPGEMPTSTVRTQEPDGE